MGDKQVVAGGLGCAFLFLLLNIVFYVALIGGAIWIIVFVLQQMNVI